MTKNRQLWELSLIISMKQILTTAFFILCISSIALAQKTTGKLLFEQGQTLEITLQPYRNKRWARLLILMWMPAALMPIK